MLLAGDLGATNCRLAVFDDNLKILDQKKYKCKDYPSFEAIITDFSQNCSYALEKACFGLPGPIKLGKCKLTNLPWAEIDAAKLTSIINIPVTLLNDVQANAYGIETLADKEIIILNVGEKIPDGNKAVIAPGTGLGEAGLISVNGDIHAIATEGGNCDFAPLNEEQFKLIQYIEKQDGFNRISYETILSGPGIVRIYNFLLEQNNSSTPQWLKEEMKKNDPAGAISNAGLENKCTICVQTLDIFISILAAEAANTALKFLATGGVYLGGGIPPRIVERLRQPIFMENFINKDKMKELLKTIPIYVILNDQTALQGAAWYARRNNS